MQPLRPEAHAMLSAPHARAAASSSLLSSSISSSYVRSSKMMNGNNGVRARPLSVPNIATGSSRGGGGGCGGGVERRTIIHTLVAIWLVVSLFTTLNMQLQIVRRSVLSASVEPRQDHPPLDPQYQPITTTMLLRRTYSVDAVGAATKTPAPTRRASLESTTTTTSGNVKRKTPILIDQRGPNVTTNRIKGTDPSQTTKLVSIQREPWRKAGVNTTLDSQQKPSPPIILPHVFDRDQDGQWEPQLSRVQSLNDIDDVFFYDSHTDGGSGRDHNNHRPTLHRPINSALPSREFLLFIRITKSASSSILRFLQRAPNVRASNNFVRFDDFRSHGENRPLAQAVSCAFSSRHPLLTTSAPPPPDVRMWNCPHHSYSRLVADWTRSLPFLNNTLFSPPITTKSPEEQQQPPSATDQGDNALSHPGVVDSQRQTVAESAAVDDHTPVQIHFKVFTIVRDPFDRMVSYYMFWRQIYPDWLQGTPPLWLPRLIGGNLESWMELRANATVNRLDSSDQSLYLSQDVDRAIRLVTAQNTSIASVVSTSNGNASSAAVETVAGTTLRVVPLVSECFDASVSLLVDLFPNVFETGSERDFLRSQSKLSNTRSEPRPELGMVPVDRSTNMTALRRRAYRWFADDYRFYDASVQQFRELLVTSGVDRDTVRDCLRTLDDRQEQRMLLLQ